MLTTRRHDRVRFEILERIAASCDAQLTGHFPDVLGLEARQVAGSIVTCGTQLLSLLVDSPPTKEHAKRERKALVGALNPENGMVASIFFAHGLARFSVENFERVARFYEDAHPPMPAEYQALELLREHYPLDDERQTTLDQAARYYSYFDLEPGDPAAADAPPSSGWLMYLTGDREIHDDQEMRDVIDGHFIVASQTFTNEASAYGLGLITQDAAEPIRGVGWESLLISLRLKTTWDGALDNYWSLLGDVSVPVDEA
jgi:hypothetical protein